MRLIDADALMARIENSARNAGLHNPDYHKVKRFVATSPTIDTEPVRHGRWTWITEDVYRCENCGERVRVKEVMGKPDWDYCPNCGAKMDGGAEDG